MRRVCRLTLLTTKYHITGSPEVSQGIAVVRERNVQGVNGITN